MNYYDSVASIFWQNSAWKRVSDILFEKPKEAQVVASSITRPGYRANKWFTTMANLPQSAVILTRIAGVSGALAVGLGAYGAHVMRKKEPKELQIAFDTANQYHLFHTLALLGVPLTSRPMLTGALFTFGMLLFCGACYHYALTGNTNSRKYAPYGGMLLILGWLSMLL